VGSVIVAQKHKIPYRSIPRVTKVSGMYTMYAPAEANVPQPTTASTSIAGAPADACPIPLVPFGVLSGAACAGASIASGGACDVHCYPGFVSNGELLLRDWELRCNSGTLAHSACVPASSHSTIYVVGAPEINGEYEFVPNTSPLKWKSATGAEIRGVAH
jgi:hypothetical protein